MSYSLIDNNLSSSSSKSGSSESSQPSLDKYKRDEAKLPAGVEEGDDKEGKLCAPAGVEEGDDEVGKSNSNILIAASRSAT